MKLRWVCFLVSTLAAGHGWARATTYALAIGNNAPPEAASESLSTLQYADDDAARTYLFFSHLGARAEVLTVLDAASQRRYPEIAAKARPPTLAELARVIDEFSASIHADLERGDAPVVYLSFSGHGAQALDGAFFLAFEGGTLSRTQLHNDVLAKLEPAMVHLFIDACHAEGVVGERGASAVKEFDVPTVKVDANEAQAAFAPRLPARFSRVGAVLATTADTQAHEWSRIESGVFTHELLSGLSGAADVNGDGAIEYSELQAFIASANRDVPDARAVPRVVAVAPRINVHTPVIMLKQFKSVGFLSGAFSVGHFYVEFENGARGPEANLVGDAPSKVAVPAGRFFVVANQREAEITVSDGQTVSLQSLEWVPHSEAVRGSISASLSKALFESPYGETYYKGYVDSLGETSVLFRAVGHPTPSGPLTVRQVWAVTTLSFAGAAAVATGISAVVAANARARYNATDIQRQAFEAQSQANTFTVAAIVTAAVATGSTVAGLVLLRPVTEVDVSVSPGGVAVRGTW